ncbi:uncharacterized protein LOC121886911 isoform X1 [Thunnus maccoyii]|uniref:uncharacterized protein LOC121886911 isoform X1 n=1 Tax=Thunnus maccoyii TaxID=8240 RepID=UPI001C4D3A3A|nr:uncharacterized protein LOC121886911 isoform X1 [Thunnus maccoyii]
MKALWWSCVLGLLFLPTEVTLNTWTVSQNPSSISVITVNSSDEITCSTALPNPMGFYLQRRFHNTKDVVFLSLEEGRISKNTTAAEFEGRIHITPVKQIVQGCGFTLRLSSLRLDDTDLYYCSWTYFKSETRVTHPSNGTVIIVKEKDPSEQCNSHFLDLILITLSVTAFTIIMFLVIGALILRCKRFKKDFRPVRPEITPRPNRPEHVCHPRRAQHFPYLVTSENTCGPLDFRGIL